MSNVESIAPNEEQSAQFLEDQAQDVRQDNVEAMVGLFFNKDGTITKFHAGIDDETFFKVVGALRDMEFWLFTEGIEDDS